MAGSAHNRTAKLKARSHAIGSMVSEFGGTAMPRIAAAVGLDFLVFDLEHGFVEPRELRDAIAVCRLSGIVSIVRVPAIEKVAVKRALEMGADGILAPTVESPDEAVALVSMCQYPPSGIRGAAFNTAHDDYSPTPVEVAVAKANASVLVLCMIESVKGLECADEIARVKGVSGLWYGYIDYSLSAGMPGKLDSELVIAAGKRIAEVCRAEAIYAAIGVASAETANTAIRDGYNILAWGSDVHLLKSGMQAGVTEINKHIRKSI